MSRLVRALAAAAVAAASVFCALPAAATGPLTATSAVGGNARAGTTPETASAAGPVAGDVNDFTFTSLHADYTLGRDDDGTSTLTVVETFVADFPETDQNHGMKRAIPDSYNGQPLDLRLISVTDAGGAPRPAVVGRGDGQYTITSRSDGYVHGAQTYVFTYTLRHVTWYFGDDDADEFYWDVNGNGWSQPFGVVTATVHVPAALASALDGNRRCYAGAYGATTGCEISAAAGADGSTVISATASDVAPEATMTIAVGFAPGTFTSFDTSPLASPWGWAQGVGGLGVLGAIVWAVIVRVRRLKDAPGRPTVIAEYTPPEGADALLSAVFTGRTSKAVPAEVLEQAVGGSIRLLEGERRVFGARKMQAQLVDASRVADADGRMLLEGLFGRAAAPGAMFTFGGSSTRFTKAGQKMLAWATAEVKRRGWRRRVPAKTRAWPMVLAAAGFALTIGSGIGALASYVAPGFAAGLMVGGTAGFVASIVLLARRPLSARGAEVRDHLEGLKMFIEWAEADRIRMLQSPSGAERVPVDPGDPRQMLRLYEKLLPYAVVFGQEKKWAEQLAVMYPAGQAPYWYAGNTAAFNAAAFSAGIGSLTSAAASSSSTSGGSGGGGSAGGGGGGGGGGGV